MLRSDDSEGLDLTFALRRPSQPSALLITTAVPLQEHAPDTSGNRLFLSFPPFPPKRLARAPRARSDTSFAPARARTPPNPVHSPEIQHFALISTQNNASANEVSPRYFLRTGFDSNVVSDSKSK